ncbi:hypothetical protein ABE521_00390 [Pseudomonas sp. TWI672]|uniref:hypothetical protein n=1 Tax=unclassified Pseudomonas TaxID=196821 RepID=UPI00320B411B
MNISRRGLLRASFQTTLVAASSSALASPLLSNISQPNGSIVLLTNISQGRMISSALQTWRSLSVSNITEHVLDEHLLFDSAGLRTLLLNHRGSRVVALVDSCADSLLHEAIRDIHGTLLLRGTHAAGATFYLHALQTSQKTQGCGAALARAISQPGVDTWVSERNQGTLAKASSNIALNLPRGETPEAIGSALALLAANAWPTDSAPIATAIPNNKELVISETFMTLIADV